MDDNGCVGELCVLVAVLADIAPAGGPARRKSISSELGERFVLTVASRGVRLKRELFGSLVGKGGTRSSKVFFVAGADFGIIPVISPLLRREELFHGLPLLELGLPLRSVADFCFCTGPVFRRKCARSSTRSV